MSAEATVAVFEHAVGTDAEWRMLAIMANAANPRGIVSGISMEELAAAVGKTSRGASDIKRRLIQSGQLIVLDEGGGRGKAATYWIKLPGLLGPEEGTVVVFRVAGPDGTLQDRVIPRDQLPGNGEATLNDSAGNGAGASNQGEKKPSSSSHVEALLNLELKDTDVPGEMRAEAIALLRAKRKVDGKFVTPAEMAFAAACLAAFNRDFEWKGRKGSELGLASALTSIVMRVRDRPTWDIHRHVRLVESAWRIRWWERTGDGRRPTPNVIWGKGAFEQVIQDAGEEAAGKTQTSGYGRRARESARS